MKNLSLIKNVLHATSLFLSIFLLCQAVAFAGEESWQKHFVKDKSEIPTNKFRAYYFDERTAGIIRHSEIVDRPAANFVRDKFHGIPGDNFGAYWIGYLTFKATTNMRINLYQGRSESRLIIDGETVPEGGGLKSSRSIPFTFTPGRHKVEVQFVSNYFSVSFLVNFLPDTTIHSDASLTDTLSEIQNPTIWYCGAYESDNFDMSVDISLDMYSDPVVLFLSSYQPIVWKFSNSGGSGLHTIVLSSYGPRSTVENAPKHVQILHYNNLPYVYEIIPKGSSSSSSRNTFKNLAYKIQSLTGKKPVGFSGKYGLTSVSVPETILDEAKYSQFGMRLHGTKKSGKHTSGSRLDRVFE